MNGDNPELERRTESRMQELEKRTEARMQETEKHKAILDLRISAVEFAVNQQASRWTQTFDIVFKLLVAGFGAVLAWKLSSH